MNKAFEKISERLDGDCWLTTNDDGETNELSIKVVSLEDAKKIVQEVAEEYKGMYVSKEQVGYMLDRIEMRGDETWMDYYRKALKGLCALTDEEYNNGWISCSDRLPEVKINPVTNDYVRYNVIYKNGDVVDVRTYAYGEASGGKHWLNTGCIMDEYVISWQPLPEAVLN